MAEQKLIQGAFTGKVGGLVGQIQHGKAIIKTTANGITKTTKEQKKAVRAFEALNRLSSAISKTLWYQLNLTNKGMHKHNAVSKWLKPIIQNKTFDLSKINEVIPASNLLTIEQFIVDTTKGVLEIKINRKPELETLNNLKTTLIIVDVQGYVYHIGETPKEKTVIKIKAQIQKATKIQAFYIITYTDNSKKIQITSNITQKKALEIIQDNVWYTSRMKNVLITIKNPTTIQITGQISVEKNQISNRLVLKNKQKQAIINKK